MALFSLSHPYLLPPTSAALPYLWHPPRAPPCPRSIAGIACDAMGYREPLRLGK